jgi:hypothetical protein
MAELTSSFRNLKKKTEPRLVLLSGNLGIKLGGQELVDVPGRAGWVFVRLLNNNSELIQAYNGVVSPIYNLPIQVKRNKDRYEIYGRDTLRYQNWGATPYLPIHGNQHSFNGPGGGGGDVVWVHQEQFYPLAPTPTGTSGGGGLVIAPYVYNWFGDWRYAGNTGTANVALAHPTDPTKAKLLLLAINGATSNPHFITGSVEVSASITGTAELVPYFPSDWYNPLVDIPLAVIRITSGTSSIGWDEIYDVRQFYGREISGSTGTSGGGGHVIQNEGIPFANRANLNFSGFGVSLFDDPGNNATYVAIDANVYNGAGGTDGNLVVFDGATGHIIKDGGPLPTGTTFYIDQIGQTGTCSYGTLLGARNGVNTAFVVSKHTYLSGTLGVFLNGQLQTQGVDDWHEDFPPSGTFHFSTPPIASDIITAMYGCLLVSPPYSNERTYTWVVDTPVAGGIPGPRLKTLHTATRIDSFIVGGTFVQFNIEERSVIGSTGTNIMGTDMSADANGETTTSFTNPSLAADNWLWLDISGVSGSVSKFVVTLAGEV